MSDLELNGKVAIVTGSGQGLGRAYATALGAAGAALVVNDVNEQAAAETAEMIRAAGGRAKVEIAAVGPSDAAQALVDRAVGEFGRLDIGSPAGQFGNFGQTNYAAVKAGIVTFARVWSMELARDRITANAVIPTAWTQMTATIPIYAPLVDGAAEGAEFPTDVRRDHAIGWPEECAPLVVFLASDAAADVNGQALGLGGDRQPSGVKLPALNLEQAAGA